MTSLEVKVSNIDVPSGGLVQESDDDYRKRILSAPEAFSTCGSVAAYDYHVRAVSQAIADVNVATPKGGLVRITVLTKKASLIADCLMTSSNMSVAKTTSALRYC